MTTAHKIELESVFLISIVAAASLFFVVQKNTQFNASAVSIDSPLAGAPTKEPEQSISSQISPDGEKKVIMETTSNEDNTKTYNISVSDGSGANENLIFSKILDAASSIAIPFNTFSSDNKYFFIQENANNNISIFVFHTSGEPFSDTEKYLEGVSLFKDRNTGYNFSEATGWASESLIIMNTTGEDGAKGPSYWLEIPSKAVIQLSTEF